MFCVAALLEYLATVCFNESIGNGHATTTTNDDGATIYGSTNVHATTTSHATASGIDQYGLFYH